MPAPVNSQAYLTTTPAGMRPLDISNEIFKYRPEETTILTLLMALNRVTVDDREFRINIQDQDPGYVTVVTQANDGVNITVSADDVKYIRPGLTLRVDWQTVALVTAVNYATGQVTLDNNTGFTAGSIPNLGSAAVEELAQRPSVVSRVPAQVTNFAENAWDTYGQSRWVETVKFYGGALGYHNREQAMYEHKRGIDRGLWFNAKAQTTGPQGNTLYKTGGVMNMITTNVSGFGSNQFTINKLRTAMTQGTRFMRSSTVWLFVSRLGSELFDRAVFNKGNITPVYENILNINITSFRMCGKTWKLMIVDHLSNNCSDVMAAIDPAALEIVTTRDQQTKTRQWMLERKLTPENGLTTDGTIGDIYTDFGLRIQEKSCMLLHGASSLGTEA